MSVNLDKKCIEQPTIIGLNLEVWSNGDVNFAVPATETEQLPVIPLQAQLRNTNSATLKLRCDCNDNQQHLYVLSFGSWIDLGHVGLPCNC